MLLLFLLQLPGEIGQFDVLELGEMLLQLRRLLDIRARLRLPDSLASPFLSLARTPLSCDEGACEGETRGPTGGVLLEGGSHLYTWTGPGFSLSSSASRELSSVLSTSLSGQLFLQILN